MNRARISRSLMALCWMGLLAACGGTDFSSGNGTPPTAPATNPKTDDQKPKTNTPATPPDQPTKETPSDLPTASSEKISQTFTAQASRPVDIVVALDTSPSMIQEKAALEKNMKIFIDALTQGNIDAKITMLAKVTSLTDPDNMGGSPVNFPPNDRFRTVDQYIHSVDAIGHLSNFFAGKYGYPFPLRTDAAVEIVIISDDDGSDANNNVYHVAGNLASEFKGPSKPYVVNAIVGLTKGLSTTNPDCDIANVGTQHMTLAQQTGGTIVDLCTPDWNQLLQKLSDSVTSRNAPYKLSHDPDPNMETAVFVDGKLVDKKNYVLDAATKTLRFNAAFPVAAGAQVKVEYYYTH